MFIICNSLPGHNITEPPLKGILGKMLQGARALLSLLDLSMLTVVRLEYIVRLISEEYITQLGHYSISLGLCKCD